MNVQFIQACASGSPRHCIMAETAKAEAVMGNGHQLVDSVHVKNVPGDNESSIDEAEDKEVSVMEMTESASYVFDGVKEAILSSMSSLFHLFAEDAVWLLERSEAQTVSGAAICMIAKMILSQFTDIVSPQSEWSRVLAILSSNVANVGLKRAMLFKHLIPVLRGMEHEAAVKIAQQARVQSPKSSPILLANAGQYCNYAMYAYTRDLLKVVGLMSPRYKPEIHGWTSIDVAAWHLGLPKNAINFNGLSEHAEQEETCYFVAVDPHTNETVVAIRGTNNLNDVYTDLVCESTPFEDGYAHGGMASAANKLFAELQQNVAEYLGGDIVVCGHSLGAGVALLLTKLLLVNGHKARCYAFAPPPCFGPLDKVDDSWSNAVECFVFHFDIVPTLSLASICEYLMDPSDLANLSPNLTKPLYIPSRNGVNWILPADYSQHPSWWNLKARARESHEMFPLFPWHRHDIPPAARPRERFQSFVVDTRTFNRILIAYHCVANHSSASYIGAFASFSAMQPFSMQSTAYPGRRRGGRGRFRNRDRIQGNDDIGENKVLGKSKKRIT